MIEPERLQGVPLFGDLDAHDLALIARWVEEVHADPGQMLIEQGSMPYELVVIEDGTVDVVRDGGPSRPSALATWSARSPCSDSIGAWRRWSPRRGFGR